MGKIEIPAYISFVVDDTLNYDTHIIKAGRDLLTSFVFLYINDHIGIFSLFSLLTLCPTFFLCTIFYLIPFHILTASSSLLVEN